jgi:hypothetical protein
MADPRVKIRIGAEYEGAAVKQAERDLKTLGSQAKSAGSALREIGRGISQGIGQGISGAALTKLGQIPEVLAATVRMGVQFNATLESARYGVAVRGRQLHKR